MLSDDPQSAAAAAATFRAAPLFSLLASLPLASLAFPPKPPPPSGRHPGIGGDPRSMGVDELLRIHGLRPRGQDGSDRGGAPDGRPQPPPPQKVSRCASPRSTAKRGKHVPSTYTCHTR